MIKDLTDIWENNKDKRYRDDISHIRGTEGRWTDIKRWEAQGKLSLKNITETFKILDKKPKDLVIMEWGPGGGTNIAGLSEITSKYIGVDISKTNLEESNKIAIEKNVKYETILLNDESFKNDFENIKDVDVFLSTAVFQHFPSEKFAIEVLKIAYKVMKENAIGIIQIRYQNEKYGRVTIDNIEDYKERHLSSLLFTLEEFWIKLKNAGFIPLYIKDIGGSNYATYIFKR